MHIFTLHYLCSIHQTSTATCLNFHFECAWVSCFRKNKIKKKLNRNVIKHFCSSWKLQRIFFSFFLLFFLIFLGCFPRVFRFFDSFQVITRQTYVLYFGWKAENNSMYTWFFETLMVFLLHLFVFQIIFRLVSVYMPFLHGKTWNGLSVYMFLLFAVWNV